MRRLALSLLLLSMLTGCWSSIELNDQAFISLMIIDRNDDGIEVTFGIPLTNNLAGGEAAGSAANGQVFGYFSRTAPSLEEAIQKVQGDLSRRANLGQNRNIIVGRAFAESGITPILEMAARNPYIRLNTNLFFVDGYAKDEVANSNVVSERFLVTILKKYIEHRTVLETSIKDFMLSKASGGDGLLPIITFSDKSKGAVVGLSSTAGTGGAAIIRNGKLVEPFLTPQQASVAQSIRNQLGQYYFSVQSPTDGKDVGLYSTSIDVKTKIKNHTIMVQPVSEVVVTGNNSSINLTINEDIEKLEKVIMDDSNEQLTSTMEVIQQSGADVFHFDRYYAMKYPKEMAKLKDNWRDFYKDRLVIEFDSVVHLRRKGATVRSFYNKFITENEDGGDGS
ncbi:Ger(x)C family spore germination protein [Paenibacillus septentrionalis]|uniref:Ger(X)C family spore germination protein n=1 Tax=Paenibacillus septentrionalis TaxID=429342 RepID=A0ABW1V786_9BACL